MELWMQSTALPLDEKVEVSRRSIRNALSAASQPAIGFSGGKKSVVLFHLSRHECTLPLKVFYVQTGNEFENATQFVGKLKKLWRLELVVEASTDDKPAVDPDLCCRPAVGATLRHLVQKHAIDCLLLGNNFEDPREIRPPDVSGISCINPIFHFSNIDIRTYIEEHRIPQCSLYDKGYEKLDCTRCTPVPNDKSSDATVDRDEQLIQEKLRRLGYL